MAGCTGRDFGSNEVKVNTPFTEGISNVILIKNIETIPKDVVLPSDQMDLSFIIENLDDSKSLKNVHVELFDAGSFKNTQGLCNLATVICIPEDVSLCKGEKCLLGSLPPGGQRLINYQLITPSSTDILDLSTDFELRFSVEHDFDARTIYRPVAVNLDEIKALQRAGQQVSVDAPTSVSSGPLKMDVSLRTRQFILNKNRATFEVKARHTGSGRLKDGGIEGGKLKVTFVGMGSCDNYEEPVGVKFINRNTIINGAASCIFTSAKEDAIKLFSEGESSPLLFTLKAVDIGAAPQTSFEVRAEADYTYRVSGTAKVTVKPPLA